MARLLLVSQVGAGAAGRRPGHCPFPQELEARVPEGQHLFEDLLRLGPTRGASEELEDLRYRWMLYKSKLKDSRQLLVGAGGGSRPGDGLLVGAGGEEGQVPPGDGAAGGCRAAGPARAMELLVGAGRQVPPGPWAAGGCRVTGFAWAMGLRLSHAHLGTLGHTHRPVLQGPD